MDPAIIIAAITAATSILKQVEVYSRGQMSPEELRVFHAQVQAFMHRVQQDADILREGN